MLFLGLGSAKVLFVLLTLISVFAQAYAASIIFGLVTVVAGLGALFAPMFWLSLALSHAPTAGDVQDANAVLRAWRAERGTWAAKTITDDLPREPVADNDWLKVAAMREVEAVGLANR